MNAEWFVTDRSVVEDILLTGVKRNVRFYKLENHSGEEKYVTEELFEKMKSSGQITTLH